MGYFLGQHNPSNYFALTVKELKLPVTGYIYAIKPILVGLLPPAIYNFLHKKNLKATM